MIKSLMAVPALLTVTMISGLAYAGSQPSDKRWWPNQTQSANTLSGEEAMASANRLTPQPVAPKSHQYRGGPRSFH